MRHLLPLTALTLHALAATAEPALLSHAGYLLGPDDHPVDGAVSLTFALFAGASGGSPTWASDPCSVAVKAGYYSVDLGAACNNAVAPLEVADVAGERWLEVRVGGTTLQPRHALVEAPRAVHATHLSGGSVDATSVSVAGQLVIEASGRLAGPARYSAGAGVAIDDATQTITLDPSCGVGEVLVRTAAGWACQPAGPPASSIVSLQGTTPGTAQTGHVNVSGTIQAGSFAGSAAGLTNLPGGQLAANSVPATALTSGSGNADKVLAAVASGAPVWVDPSTLPSISGAGGGWTASGSDAVKASGNAIVAAGDMRLTGLGRRIWLTDPSNGYCYALQMLSGAFVTPRIDCTTGQNLQVGMFDGNFGYAQVPDSPLWDFPGDFTLEAWVRSRVTAERFFLVHSASGCDGGCITLSASSTVVTFVGLNTDSSSNTTLSAPTGLNVNTWYHVAVRRSGTNLSLFVNGTAVASTTSSLSFSGSTGSMGAAGVGTSTGRWNGFLSDVRVSGVSRYAGNFTPPARGTLVADAQTRLLLKMDGIGLPFVDSSANNFTVTHHASGGATQTAAP